MPTRSTRFGDARRRRVTAHRLDLHARRTTLRRQGQRALTHCDTAGAQVFVCRYERAMLRIQRGAKPMPATDLESCTVTDIPYHGPAEP